MSPPTPPHALSRRRRLLYGLAFASVLWFSVEGLCRLIWGPPPPSDMVVRMSQCALVIEGARAKLDCEPGEHADVEFATQPSPDRPRVVFLGGSSVRETHNTNAVTNFPSEVGKRLPGIEVLNFGVPGMGAANLALLASQLDAVSPNLVVIYSGHNDYSVDVFHGAISATRLWMLPFYQLAANSWVHGALARRPRGTPRHERPRGLVIPTDDGLAMQVRDAVDARFRSDLALAVRESPAPVLLCTLLRNPDVPPTGVLTKGLPDCAAQLTSLGNPNGNATSRAAQARTACGESSITAWWTSQTLKHNPSQASAAWYDSLTRDAVPLRAPPSADRIIREVALQTNATVVDLEQTIGPLAPSHLFVDTLHLSPSGAGAVADALVPHIEAGVQPR